MKSEQFIHLVKELRALPKECEWVEFKQNNANPEQIGENLSAIANSALLVGRAKGFIVYGIEDGTHNITGTSFDPDKQKIKKQELLNYLETQLTPMVHFEFHTDVVDGKKIVIIEIDTPSSHPIRFKKEAYIRIGSYTKKLKDHPKQEQQVWSKLNQVSFEKGLATEPLKIPEILKLINYPDVFRYLELGIPASRDSIIEKLIEEKILIEEHGLYAITNLGALLFAYDLGQFDGLSRKKPRVIIYRGTNKLKAIKENEFVEGYVNSFKSIVDFINDQLPQNEEVERALRIDVRIYPEIAIRELVANALIHQDLNIKGTGVMIEIFENRLEITNPGAPIIDIVRFIDHSPESRNEVLARLMRRMRICEERGSGIDKVISSIENYQLPAPEFITDNNYTRVKLYSPKTLRQMTTEDKSRATFQHCVLKYISGDYMSNKSLRERFGIDDGNYPQASRIIKSTIEAGLIKSYGASKTYVPFWVD